MTDPDSHVTTYCSDYLGQVTKVVDARSLSHNGSYNPAGNVTDFNQLTGSGATADWTLGYATNNQDLQTVSLPSSGTGKTSASETICYAGGSCNGHTGGGSGPAHFPTSVYSFNNDTTSTPTYTYTYDTRGNMTTASNPNDGATTYSWTTPSYLVNQSSKVLTSILDARGNTTTLGYDSEGNLTSVSRPSPGDGSLSITYDALSRVHTITNGNGVTKTFTYDPLDRVKTVTFSDSTHSLTYGYDENGNLTSRTDAIGSWGFGYDALNRRTSETRPSPDANVSYTYYDSGPVHTITDGNGTTTYAYNAVNLPNSIKDPQNAETTISYQVHSNQRDTITYPNGVTVAYTWKNAGQVASVTAKNPGGTVLLSRTYDYTDPSNSSQDFNRVNSVTDQSGSTTSYTYNAVDRIKAATTGTQVYNYNLYDDNGNLTQSTDPSGTVTHYTYNADNELTCKYTGAACSGSGFTTYGYDADGNLTSSSAGFSASYNGLDQLTTGSNTYADAGQTLRIGSGTTHFTYTQLGMASTTASSTTTNFTRNSDGTLLGMATGTGSSSKDYYILDGLGSVIGVTDSTGSLARSYTYDPYGNSTGGTGTLSQPWQYASGYHDTTSPTSGFYKFGTRYYDPANMRWTQLDPKGGTLSDPMSQNGYLYVNADPVNAVDPTGQLSPYVELFFGTDSFLFTGGFTAACIEGATTSAVTGAVPVAIVACTPAAIVGFSVAGYEIYSAVTGIF